MKKKPLILIVDDEVAILETLKSALQDEHFFVETLSDGAQVLDTIVALVPDVVLLDICMPPYDGLKLLEEIKQQHPKQKVVMISGFGNISIAVQALKNGASDFIEKPLNLDDILEKLSYLLEPRIIQTQRHLHEFEKYGIEGKSSLFLELMHHVTTAANLRGPHLFLGGEGTGRTTMARYVHQKSLKAQKPFVIFDCSSNNVDITWALYNNSGTLFLRNMHLLQKEYQQILHTYLNQEQHEQQVSVMASCHTRIFDLVQQGCFLPSLFVQFQSCPIEVPSLNKRRYDIPLLTDYFLRRANTLYGYNVGITSGAIRMLRNHVWERNVAQLQECLYFAVAQAPNSSHVITVEDLLVMLPEKQVSFVDAHLFSHFESLQDATESFQKIYLTHLLKQHKYDLKKISFLLHLNILELHDTIVRLGINVL